MMLPLDARKRLAERLSDQPSVPLRNRHTVPIATDVWEVYAIALVERLEALADVIEEQHGPNATFDELRHWVDRVTEARASALSLLFALEPFAPFEHARAERILTQVRVAIEAAATALREFCAPARSNGLRDATRQWPLQGGSRRDELLKEAFKLDEPPVDGVNSFRPTLVFRAYAYGHIQLIQTVAPHLTSVGTNSNDLLAAVSLVGTITWAPDQVLAYITMTEMLQGLRRAGPDVSVPLLAHFRRRESVDRQLRADIAYRRNELADIDTDDEERTARLIADIYVQVVERARHFGWALACLSSGRWASPPMLSRVQESMTAAGGFPAHAAHEAFLVSVRNAIAHGDLEWDGINQGYRVDDGLVELSVVLGAGRYALSLISGCEAATLTFRAENAVASLGPPATGDPDRMPSWERAEAFFGTNKLLLVEARLNSSTARVVLAELREPQINPCLQALLCVHTLFPQIERFEVRIATSDDVAISVAAESLEHTALVWQAALQTFDAMPLSTFLPANYGARSASERPLLAARSIAWIAADDALGPVLRMGRSQGR